jgi:hypothetical protein
MTLFAGKLMELEIIMLRETPRKTNITFFSNVESRSKKKKKKSSSTKGELCGGTSQQEEGR